MVDEITMPSGAKQSKQYDVMGRLTQIAARTSANAVVNQFAYTYDRAGQRIQEATLAYTRDFAYNDTRELVSATKTPVGQGAPLPSSLTYSFDPIGNRVSATTTQGTTPPETTAYTVNAVNQYTQIAAPTAQIAPTYDPNGNTLSSPLQSSASSAQSAGTFTYDEENRLLSATTGNTKEEYLYDGLSRRVATRRFTRTSPSDSWILDSEFRFVYDGWLQVQELDANNNVVRHYTRGLDVAQTFDSTGGVGSLLALKQFAVGPVSQEATAFYFYDGNGNVMNLLGDSDQTLATYEYDPFGRKLLSTGTLASQPFQFSTKEFSEVTGLNYYGYRFYNAQTGRWLSRDPIEEQGGLNLYGFVGNDAISLVDRNGLDIWQDTNQTINQVKRWSEEKGNQTVKWFSETHEDHMLRIYGTIDNIKFFYDWTTNSGSDDRRYKDGDRLVELLKKSNGIRKALAKYKEDGCKDNFTDFYDTMEGYRDVISKMGWFNPSEWQIGGYIYTITKISKSEVEIHIVNQASRKSLFGQPTFSRWYNQRSGDLQDVVNPLINSTNENLSNFNIPSIPTLDIPEWKEWPIHLRDNVNWGGSIRQEFTFRMPNPCCSME